MVTVTHLDEVDEFLQFVAPGVFTVLGLVRLLQAGLGQDPAVVNPGVVRLDLLEVSQSVSYVGSVGGVRTRLL